MTANYYRSLKKIWERYHEKDMPENSLNWQSWSKQERSREEHNK
jgi:hypothetical protein